MATTKAFALILALGLSADGTATARTDVHASQAVGLLRVLYSEGSEGSCTATLISSDLILTNAHCIAANSEHGHPIQLVVVFGDGGATQVPEVYGVVTEPVEVSRTMDYAVLRVPQPLASGRLTLPVCVAPAVVGATLSVVHHAHGEPQQVDACLIRDVSGDDVTLACNLGGGSSGALFLDANGCVVALNYAGAVDPDAKREMAKQFERVVEVSPLLQGLANRDHS